MRIPWIVHSMGLQRVRHDWTTFISVHFTSLISFISVLSFPAYNSCICFISSTPKYFFFFLAIVRGIVFLISVSTYSLLVYIEVQLIFWYALVLCPVTLLNSLMSSRSWSVDSLEFSSKASSHLKIGTILCFLFQSICLLFPVLALLIWLVLPLLYLTVMVGVDIFALFQIFWWGE